MFGGAFLCFEGVEKLAHKLFHPEEEAAEDAELLAKVSDPNADLVAFENEKIKGAITTDFILSAEIVTIALGTVATAAFATRVSVLVGISALMTVGVYGLVAAIVKLDDLGFFLYWRGKERTGALGRLECGTGAAILHTAPYLMKGLSVAGTAAMFLVGGGILAHGLPGAEHWFEELARDSRGIQGVGDILAFVLPTLLQVLLGVLVGALALVVVTLVQRIRGVK
jgi:predicted DNA repair protein MutK